jgi:hypothetical protein
VIFAAWAVSEGIIAASVALTGTLREVTVCWLAIPIMTLSARFSLRGIVVGVTLTLALMAAVLLSADAGAVVSEPPVLLAPVGLVIASAMLSTALIRSDIEHRGEALIDPLTGMLNRNALTRRTEEITQQSEVSGDPVGVIVADIDHFRASTTPMAMPPAMPSSRTLPTGCASTCAPSSRPTGWAARSS